MIKPKNWEPTETDIQDIITGKITFWRPTKANIQDIIDGKITKLPAYFGDILDVAEISYSGVDKHGSLYVGAYLVGPTGVGKIRHYFKEDALVKVNNAMDFFSSQIYSGIIDAVTRASKSNLVIQELFNDAIKNLDINKIHKAYLILIKE